MRQEILVVGGYVGLVVGIAEEAVEGRVVGEVPDGCQLQAIECDVRRIEIHDGDVRGARGQIAHHVAATGRDRHDTARRLEREGFEIDDRILPDLGIDQPGERQRECPFRYTLSRERGTPIDGCPDELCARTPRGLHRSRHVILLGLQQPTACET